MLFSVIINRRDLKCELGSQALRRQGSWCVSAQTVVKHLHSPISHLELSCQYMPAIVKRRTSDGQINYRCLIPTLFSFLDITEVCSGEGLLNFAVIQFAIAIKPTASCDVGMDLGGSSQILRVGC